MQLDIESILKKRHGFVNGQRDGEISKGVIVFTLVTDNISSEHFINSMRLGNDTNLIESRGRQRGNSREQALLLELIIAGLHIAPDTSLSDMVTFKERHKDELGLFRTQLTKLTQGISIDIPVNAVQQELNDLFINEFLPAYNNFKSALKSSKIKWLNDNFLKLSFLSVSTTGVPMALGLSVPCALAAGAGVSLIASVCAYNIDKKEKLRENPYSYLLAIEKEF